MDLDETIAEFRRTLLAVEAPRDQLDAMRRDSSVVLGVMQRIVELGVDKAQLFDRDAFEAAVRAVAAGFLAEQHPDELKRLIAELERRQGD